MDPTHTEVPAEQAEHETPEPITYISRGDRGYDVMLCRLSWNDDPSVAGTTRVTRAEAQAWADGFKAALAMLANRGAL